MPHCLSVFPALSAEPFENNLKFKLTCIDRVRRRRMEKTMKKMLMTGLTAILMLPSLAPAQTITVQEGVKVGKVYVTGENPGIRLLDKEGGTVLTAVSYWRLIWSPAGPGHIAFVTTGDGKSPGDLRLAFVDNRKLYDFLTKEISTVLDATFTARPYTIVEAKFVDSGQGTFNGDSMTERKVTFKAPKYDVALVWRDFYEPFQIDSPANSGARNPFGVTSLFIPSKAADVIINGKKAAGNVYPQKRGPVQSSSAFLAFSESWVK
jgi:hypothetical protein